MKKWIWCDMGCKRGMNKALWEPTQAVSSVCGYLISNCMLDVFSLIYLYVSSFHVPFKKPLSSPRLQRFSSRIFVFFAFRPMIYFELIFGIVWDKSQVNFFPDNDNHNPATFVLKIILSTLNYPGTFVTNHLTI